MIFSTKIKIKKREKTEALDTNAIEEVTAARERPQRLAVEAIMATEEMADIQRAVWRNGGSNSAENKTCFT